MVVFPGSAGLVTCVTKRFQRCSRWGWDMFCVWKRYRVAVVEEWFFVEGAGRGGEAEVRRDEQRTFCAFALALWLRGAVRVRLRRDSPLKHSGPSSLIGLVK